MNKKEEILSVALRLFSARGYANTSTSLIAKESGTSEGLLFRHYGSKEGLLKSILESGRGQVQNSLAPLMRQSITFNELAAYLEEFGTALISNREYWKLVFALRFQQDVSVLMQELISEVQQLILQKFRSVFEQAGRKDGDRQALLLFATLDGVAFHYCLFGDSYPLREVLTGVYENLNIVLSDSLMK